jgi:murein peptide amidase A
MLIRTLSRTHLGLPILAYDFGHQGIKVLILGGVHGDEIEGIACAKALLSDFQQNYSYPFKVTLIPEMNPDGSLLNKRTNSRGVDLNRNMATQDWSPEIKSERYHPGPSPMSEIENQILAEELKSTQFVLSLHSWHPVINVNGNCLKEAEVLAQQTGYKIDKDIGYPTPGCLGTYAGIERNIPTITYEIERGLDIKKVTDVHPKAIHKMLDFMATRK